MMIDHLNALLAMGAPAQPGQEAPPAWVSLVPMILIMVVFYMVLFRPQQKKAKEHAALLKTLKSGDRVVTNGGVVGVIISVKEKTVTIRSTDTKLEILKGSVAEITERSGDSGESK